MRNIGREKKYKRKENHKGSWEREILCHEQIRIQYWKANWRWHRLLRPYDEDLARNQYFIHTYKGGKFANEYLQLYYSINDGSEKLMVTDQYILIVNKNTVTWEVNIRVVKNITLDQTTISIIYYQTLNNPQRTCSFKLFLPNIQSPHILELECKEVFNQLISLVSLLKFNCD